ncbi:hypothetical protein HT118_22310 [Escherichia coli]|nr:hypothetical protein [Escherichia coli]
MRVNICTGAACSPHLTPLPEGARGLIELFLELFANTKLKRHKGALVCFPVFVFLSIPLVHRRVSPRRQHTSFEHVVEVPVGVDALIVCHRRFFARVKSTLFSRNIFCHLRRFFIAILNGIWLDNAAILRIDDNVCASIALVFHRQDNKREKSSKLRLKKAAMIAG